MLVTAPPSSRARTLVAPEQTRLLAPPLVSAVLVVRDGAAWLPDSLDALARSTVRPERLVVVVLASTDGSAELVRRHEGLRRVLRDVTVVEPPQALPYGAAVALAVGELGPEPPQAPEWLWLLHADTAVEPSTLQQLVEAVRRSPSVGIAGPKVVQWDDPRRLVEAGHQLTRSGRRLSAPAVGELDQGQYDARTDVLAVGTSGMLVRRSLFEQVGGFDPAFAEFGADLDLGWRAQLAGHRVVLVPGARVRDAGATRAGHGGAAGSAAAARRTARRAARRVSLTRCSLLVAPLLAAWMVLAALASALLLLVLKRPVAAWDELSDLGALVAPLRSTGARWRFRGKARLRRRDVATLFVRPGQAVRHTVDRVHDALRPEAFTAPARGRSLELAEPGPVADEAQALPRLPAALPQRILANPGVLAVTAAMAVALVGLRESVRAGLFGASEAGLSGGQLHPVTTDATGLWHAFRDAWHGSGFGTSAEPSPHLAVLAGLSWLVERFPSVAENRSPASLTLALVVAFGMPLATASAYLAGRVVTPARWVRAGVALAWGTAGASAAAVAGGRVTALLAAILLPLVAAGLARTASPLGTVTAAFATALGLGLLGALVPVFLLVGALVALALVVLGGGWAVRGRALVVLVVPVALQGPALLLLRDPARLLGAPGLLAASDPAPHPPWLLALASLDDGPSWRSFLAVPLLVMGVLGLNSRAGSREGRYARGALAALAVLGLGFALAAPRLVVGAVVEPDGRVAPATPWPGVGIQLLLLAVLAAALVGSTGWRSLLRGPRWPVRRVAAGAGLAVVSVAVLAGAAVVAASPLDATVRVDGEPLPAVAVEQAQGPLANRLLLLERTGQQVDYELVGSEPGSVLGALPARQAATDPGLAAALAPLAEATSSVGPSAERLADLGIGFVAVRAAGEDPLIRTLDAAAGLTRLGSTDGRTLWRVLARSSAAAATEAVPPSRVRLTTSAGTVLQAVPVAGPHGAVDEELAAGPAGRRVVFAEPPEWSARAQVRFDGALQSALPSQALPTYELPERAGRLTVDLPPVFERWFLGQVVLALVVVFLAIPFGNRRSRSLS